MRRANDDGLWTVHGGSHHVHSVLAKEVQRHVFHWLVARTSLSYFGQSSIVISRWMSVCLPVCLSSRWSLCTVSSLDLSYAIGTFHMKFRHSVVLITTFRILILINVSLLIVHCSGYHYHHYKSNLASFRWSVSVFCRFKYFPEIVMKFKEQQKHFLLLRFVQLLMLGARWCPTVWTRPCSATSTLTVALYLLRPCTVWLASVGKRPPFWFDIEIERIGERDRGFAMYSLQKI